MEQSDAIHCRGRHVAEHNARHGSSTGQGSGTVGAVEPAARTVVIEVPQGKETFTGST